MWIKQWNDTIVPWWTEYSCWKYFFFSNQSKVYVVVKQEIETKSWVKQICAIINHKIETKSKMNDDTVINVAENYT